MGKLVWRPAEVRALHTTEALDRHWYGFVSRVADQGEAWAARMLEDMNEPPQPELRQPRHRLELRAPRYLRRRLAAAALSGVLLVTNSLAASSPNAQREVGNVAAGASNKPAGMPDQFVGPIAPEDTSPGITSPVPQAATIECVPYDSGESIWRLAEQRASSVASGRAVGVVPLTNLLKTISVANMPEGTNPNQLPDAGCIPMPTERVAGGLYRAMSHPDSDPELAANIEQINAQSTLRHALDLDVPLADIQDAMTHFA